MAESEIKSHEAKLDFDEDVLAVIDQGPAPGPGNSEEKLDFDEDTLRAIAEVYQDEGDKEFTRKEIGNAIHFYTEGIHVNCKDVQLNAKLYSNRASAYYHLGNFHKALNDATAAVYLEPSLIKAIETGASACEHLQCYGEAISWCEMGLAINKTNKTLLDLQARNVGDQIKLQEAKSNAETHSVNGQTNTNYLPKTTKKGKASTEEGACYINVAKPVRDLKTEFKYHEQDLKIPKERDERAAEGRSNSNLGNAYYRLGNFKEAIESHERRLKIAKEVGDRAGEGMSYANLGNAYHSLGDFKKAIEYHELDLKIAKEVGERAWEGGSYGNLGNAHHCLGDFKKAIEYHELDLKIAKEVGDKAGEGSSYNNLGSAYHSLGDFKKAIEYHERHLKIAEEVGDKAGEGSSYGNLGNAYRSLGDFKKAIEYHKRHLKIAQEVGDRDAEGSSNGNLGIAYHSLGNFKKAIEYHELDLKIAKEVGDRAGEAGSYGNLGNAYYRLGDFKKAIKYHELNLKINKEVGDKAREGMSYGNLGNVHHSLGDFKKAIDYHERRLKFAKDVGDKAGEGGSYGNLGNDHYSLGDFKKAIEYHELNLKIAKEVGDKAGEGRSYGNLGNAYRSLGDFKKAIEYHELDLKIAKEVGDRAGEGRSNGNLGNAYHSLRDFQKAIEHHERRLKIAKEVGDRAGEGGSYGNLGNAYDNLGDFKKAIEYHERHLKIAKEVGSRTGEGMSYANLGNAYNSLGDFKKAIEYHERHLKIAKEVGDRAGEGSSYANLGISFEHQGCLKKALDCYYSSVRLFNDVRRYLQGKDDWTIGYRDVNNVVYTRLWRLILKQGDVVEALFAAEEGRAQALRDLMYSNYDPETPYTGEKTSCDTFSFLLSDTVFMAVHKSEIIFWIIQNGRDVQLRRKEFSENNSKENASEVLASLIHNACRKIDVSRDVKCEDRSLDRKSWGGFSKKRDQTISQPTHSDTNPLRTLYDVIIGPIKDLINGNELIFVPEGPLCLAPYAALMDSNSKYLSESFRVRVIPSLNSLKLIRDCLPDYHKKSGALLIGDPCLDGVPFRGEELCQLPCAKEEVEMIGKILNTAPLTGKEATKDEVLKKLSTVALVHIAAHGRMETGEIVLAPNPTPASQNLVEDDFLLTMSDVMRVQMRAGLVVLSCCHSGHGEIKAEGVVGIARAFLGAGARSVLVSLWAIDDEATLEFMKSFYRHLGERSASESLNCAMKCLRESEKFNEVKYWAPFVLIGDDVTLDFAKGN